MIVIGNFNKVSEKLRKELIPSIGQNEIVRFQLLNGSFEPALGREGFGASRSIRLRDYIYDPYQKESKNEKGETVYEGGHVDIGVPEAGGIKEGRVEKCKKHWVNSIAGGIPGNGQFELMGNSVSDREIIEYLCLSNDNANNPYRDQSKDPVYEKVDAKAILAKEKEQEKKELENKLKRFAKNNPDEAAELLKSLSTNGKAAVTS